MIGFDKLITPKILSALYGLTLAALLVMAVIFGLSGDAQKAIFAVIMALFSRIFFEGLMVVFKNNEYLRRIAEALEKDKTL
ncbi:DUF4282 domain-containing protein [Klebsiella pneumoniae]|uniref:DUF4282 domain-containing protein n=1 Tax=Klebsiella pneumoniae complex TaxID=3390273 RepID=UPI0009BB309D|nr:MULTISPECIES: DUF4282 domain-containing protein [Klebsiella]HCI6773183.1 DUF4282 domain-containing protein [Klebsiella quasipneumoniae subsp. similipneumoniae]HDS3975614.1 DUF4282 domain-containing protein [Klebsiella pneumoniae subsp. pneumoniae]HDS3990784.1 DUF4282 domain-containing protein [Klebsiella pneumoniae subsp. ozaenae]EKY0545119.1 DUF4282 domain-containing protein [Klebsiella pneumoniae]MBK4910962.1 DUF4282 domain-containing protein [Klebsiella pneumoniae]